MGTPGSCTRCCAGTLVALAQRTSLLRGLAQRCYVDIDSLLRPVYGHAKQGASFGHTKIAGKSVLRRGLSPLATTISTLVAAPVIAGVRLRSGRAGSSRGAASMITETTNTAVAAGARPGDIQVRGDAAFCSGKVTTAVVNTGATFSLTITRNPSVDAAIASIPDEQFTPVDYPRRGDRPGHRAAELARPGSRSAVHRLCRDPA